MLYSLGHLFLYFIFTAASKFPWHYDSISYFCQTSWKNSLNTFGYSYSSRSSPSPASALSTFPARRAPGTSESPHPVAAFMSSTCLSATWMPLEVSLKALLFGFPETVLLWISFPFYDLSLDHNLDLAELPSFIPEVSHCPPAHSVSLSSMASANIPVKCASLVLTPFLSWVMDSSMTSLG